ncbi:MAG TPA: [protein-PII] uridylyltransferase [Rudaea sp.]|jgi:[protein-PII] uridylyltransferase|nr:[protein-PII] uridylyltransferase [Rudaea sp.]
MSVVAAPVFALPRLPTSIPRAGVSEAARVSLRQLIGDTDRRLADAFRDGADIDMLLPARSRTVESVVAHVFSAIVGERAGLALYAVGGFGRGELFPHSDVDLLVLCDEPLSSGVAHALESFFTCLWDIGLKPGHAVRTVDECRDFAARDATIYTTLLDARRIAGDAQIDARLAALVADEYIWPPVDYFAAKRADQLGRYARFNDTTYNLEPNIKDAPGGLRALHLVGWLGRRLFSASAFDDLGSCGLLTAAESAESDRSRRHLSRIRFALHLAAGRAEERLLFDYQRTLAERFGFVDEHRQNLAVEQFMQGYYRAAISIERLSERFLSRCEEALDANEHEHVQRLTLDFVAIDGRLDCDPPDLLIARPATLIDLFRVWIEHPQIKSLRADLLIRIEAALDSIGPKLADDHDVNVAFLRLLRKGAPAVEAIARMNHHRVLAHYLPAFGKVVGRMQYDLFHVYTVDEHTIRVLRNVARFADAATSQEFAHAHEIWVRLPKPDVLLLAVLFHDIAKGRGGDHSELGETEARAFCTKLGLSHGDAELVAWLVRQHLLMSVTAQRQDIADPDVVHAFSGKVGDRERLDYLYLLTVADISGTSAKLWNSWKDKLLADLYTRTRDALHGGLANPPDASDRIFDCRMQAFALLREAEISQASIDAVWAQFPDESFLRFTAREIAWQTTGIVRHRKPGVPLILVEGASARGSSEVFVYAADRDGLFAAVTAVFDRLRLSVQDARIVTSRDGMSLDSFLVLDADGYAITDARHIERLRSALVDALSQNPYRADLAPRPMTRSLRHFDIPPRVSYDLARGGATHMALLCADRPGLLAMVAQTFRDCRVRVNGARIATFGERVEDYFLISDEHDRPLDGQARDALERALVARLQTNETTEERHASV